MEGYTMKKSNSELVGRVRTSIKQWFHDRLRECVRCCDCESAVTPWDSHCPSCGLENPARVSASAVVYLVLGFVLLTMILLIVAFWSDGAGRNRRPEPCDIRRAAALAGPCDWTARARELSELLGRGLFTSPSETRPATYGLDSRRFAGMGKLTPSERAAVVKRVKELSAQIQDRQLSIERIDKLHKERAVLHARLVEDKAAASWRRSAHFVDG